MKKEKSLLEREWAVYFGEKFPAHLLISKNLELKQSLVLIFRNVKIVKYAIEISSESGNLQNATRLNGKN